MTLQNKEKLGSIEPELNGVGVMGTRQIGDYRYLTYYVKNIQDEKTGVHGKIYIYDREISRNYVHPLGRRIHHDRINLDKADQRTRFANYAHTVLGDLVVDRDSIEVLRYTKEHFQFDMHSFCHDVWDTWLDKRSSILVEGNPELEVAHRIKPFALADGGTMMYARPKRGKSYMAMTMAVCVDAGLDKFWSVEQCNVLYINLERSEREMQRRLGCVNQALGLKPNRSLRFLHARGLAFNDIVDTVEKEVERHNIGWIVLDSISRSGMGDLNDNRTANRITDSLNYLIKDHDDRGWMAIAHTSWEENHVYGSIMFEAAADVMLKLDTARGSGGRLGVKFEITGANDVDPSIEVPMLSLGFNSYGLSEVTVGDEEDFEFGDSQGVEGDVVAYLKQQQRELSPMEITKGTGRPQGSVRSELKKGLEKGKYQRSATGQYSLAL